MASSRRLSATPNFSPLQCRRVADVDFTNSGVCQMINVSEVLEPIAGWFRSLGVPEAVVHWGHPAMMGIVIFVVGTFVGVTGWRGKLLEGKDKDAAIQSRNAHRTGSLVLILLLINGVISLSGFFGNKAGLRAVHAYLGSTTLLIMFVHAVLGLNLGISL